MADLGAYLCLLFFVVFSVWCGLFYMGGPLLAHFVPGFNMLPKEKQKLYDKAGIVKAASKHFGIWAVLMLAGAAGSHWIHPFVSIVAFIVWFVLVARVLKYPYSKMFKKYKLDE